MVNRLKGISIGKIDRFGRLACPQVPFLRLDRFPPGYCQPDLVAPRHEDVALIRKCMIPNLCAIPFMRRTPWKLAERFEQRCEVWFMEGMFQSKHAVRGAST